MLGPALNHAVEQARETGTLFVHQPTAVVFAHYQDPNISQLATLWIAWFRHAISSTLGLFRPRGMLAWARQPASLHRDLRMVQDFHDLGMWNSRYHFTASEMRSLVTTPVDADPNGNSYVLPPEDTARGMQVNLITDSGALMFRGKGAAHTLWECLRELPGWEGTRVLSIPGGDLTTFTSLTEALMFEHGAGPASWAEMAPARPPPGASPAEAAGGAPTLADVRAQGGSDLVRMAAGSRIMVYVYNGNDILNDKNDIVKKGTYKQICEKLAGTMAYY